jgi:hypothetical protein
MNYASDHCDGEETEVTVKTFPAIGIKVVDGMVSTLGASRPLGSLAGAQAEISGPVHRSRSRGAVRATVFVRFGDGGLHEKTFDGDMAISAAQQEVAEFNAMTAAGSVHAGEHLRSSSPAAGQPEPGSKVQFKCCNDCINRSCDKRFGSPVDLASSATECDCPRHHHHHLATLVVDPALSAEEQGRLVRYLLSAGKADWILHSAAYANMAPKSFLSWKRIFASGRDQLDSPDASRYVWPGDLGIVPHELLRRTQNAICAILESGVYGRHSSGHSVDEPALRRHEWEIAVALKEISNLDWDLECSTVNGLPGPMTVAVLDSQRKALMLAKNSTMARIGALEHYASELKMADAAERDWQAALKASSRNDQYLNLVARTAADELAISELHGLAKQVTTASEVFREHLYQVSLAAEALVLPTTPQN